MKYIELYNLFKNKTVFSIQEIYIIEPNFDKRRISEWKKKWYIKSVSKWRYTFSEKTLWDEDYFIIANIINQPSYISCESALYYYNLIPEWVFMTTSITSKKTIDYQTDIGKFRYNKISARLLFGFKLVNWINWKFKIAYKEKAILDFLYLKSQLKTEKDFLDLRIDSDEFFDGFDYSRRELYLKQFNKKTLTQRAQLLFTTIQKNA